MAASIDGNQDRSSAPVEEDAMTLRISRLLAIGSFALAALLCGAQSHEQNAYITNSRGGSVSVVDTAGQSATDSVRFDDPSFDRINFTPVIYSGSI